MMSVPRFAALSLLALATFAQTAQQPLRSVVDPGVVTTRQTITPAGVPSVFTGRVYGVAFGSTADELWVLGATHVYRLDWLHNSILESARLSGAPGLQALRFDPDSNRALIGTAARDAAKSIQLSGVSAGAVTPIGASLGSFMTGALDHNGKIAAVPLTFNNQLAVVDLASGKVLGKAPTGIAPFAAALSRDGKFAYVTNWGGRVPKSGDITAPTGTDPRADNVVVDARGVASTATVTRVDLTTFQATHTIAVQLHPTGLLWDEPRNRLYVANTNQDSVSVIDTRTQAVVQTFALQPFAQKVAGIAPVALAINADGKRLYVACGGINAIAVLDATSGKLDGMIPTAWYPNSLALSPDGKKIAVGSLLGAGSAWRDEPKQRFVHSYRGAVAVIDIPDAAQLASYSTAVSENNHVPLAGATVRTPTPVAAKTAIPARSGDPSPIEHVVFIIKENRTYDQVLGDMPQGNGDPSMLMFGREVTPNQHKLAEEFVLLDNMYATGGNSADGHQWLTQANETSYCLWPGYAGRSYPFDGTDPIAYSANGFLWDYALARGKSVRMYGEYAGRLPVPALERISLLKRFRDGEDFTATWNTKAPIAKLNSILAANYPSYTTAIPDVIRAQIFLKDLRRFEQEGKMPNLIMLQLPSDHTNGAQPNMSTAKAMVADNDLALGRIVDALSHSKFWPHMAIFVVEDDAQNGVDHVDGHRTTAFVASPYARRKHVDSTFYSSQSILKTIELIHGLPTMSLFDLIANDMRNSFTNEPDLTPFTALDPTYDLYERNPSMTALRGRANRDARRAAADSKKMRFDIPDAAPTERLNRILWHQVRGWNTPYPQIKNAVFAPLSLEIEDEDRD